MDLSGKEIGNWTVLHKSNRRMANGTAYYLCRCICGTQREVSADNLRRGITTSCGCSPTTAEAIPKEKPRHPHTYKSWAAMKYRCLNPNCSSYADYGGRGIKICDRWLSFENFLEDMGERPIGMSLDRKNPDGNYTPDNCRWADAETQALNRRAFKWTNPKGPVNKRRYLLLNAGTEPAHVELYTLQEIKQILQEHPGHIDDLYEIIPYRRKTRIT